MKRWRFLSVLILALTALYLYAFPTATISYAVTVLLHTGLGVLLTLGLVVYLFRGIGQDDQWLARIAWVLMAAGAVLGVALIYLGTSHRMNEWLYAHIALCSVGAVLLAAAWMKERGWLGASALQRIAAFGAVVLAAAGIAAGAWWVRNVAWNNAYRVNNPADFSGDHGQRRRRATGEILSEFGADNRWQEHTRRIFSAVEGVRAVPRGYLQAVGELVASLFLVQQPVVPEKH